VRGLSDRDIESLVEEAGLGQISKSAASQITQQLRARYQAFRARSLDEVRLLVLFLAATYLPTRPSGAKEGVLVAWGYVEAGQRVLVDVTLGQRVLVDVTLGQRVLVDVTLGQRERFEDWLEMGRGLIRRGLRPPMLVVTDGAPGLIRAMEELWPDADRRRCTVHRAQKPRRQAAEDGHQAARQGGGVVLGGAGRGNLGGGRRGASASARGRLGAPVPERGRQSGRGPAGPMRTR
jgi:putative transposase